MSPVRVAFLLVVSSSLLLAEEVSTTAEPPVECLYGNRTYKEGETIATENVCLHCMCRSGWTAPSSTSCAIIDCPWGYYRLRPYCVQRYIAGQCCPELTCGPPPPQLDPSYLSGKRATLTTNNYIIMAQQSSEVMIYCVIDNPDNATVEVEWTKRTKDGKEVPLNVVSKAVNDSYDNAAWGLLLESVSDEDAGVYICHIGTTPPQIQRTELKIFSRPSFVEPECLQPPEVSSPPAGGECSINASQWGYYYDGDAFNCVEHTPRCGSPPANNFATKEECWNRCSDACYKLQDPGFCEVHVERYYYSHTRDSCQRFTYNGCQGNRNNFRSHSECLSACSSVRFLHLEGKEGPGEETPSDKRQPLHCPPCAWKHWIHYLVKGCRPELEENACCPTRFDCSDVTKKPSNEKAEQQEAEPYHCSHGGMNFTQGQDISLEGDCQVCTCTKNFKGPGSPGCRPLIKCNEDEIKEKMNDGCVPVYEEGACCPVEWQCPLKDVPYRQTGPEVFYKEPPELQCSYGGRLYPRWYSLITEHGFCRSCVCLTPPYFTCVSSVCPPHPSSLNATVRCETEPRLGECCPDYKCWDITKEPDHVGKPQTEAEKKFCDDNPCDSKYYKCLVDYAACHRGECRRNCEPCPAPTCSRFSSGEHFPPYDCPTCQAFTTPELACAKYDGCSPQQTCVVDEEKCRHGECEPMCQKQELHFVLPDKSNSTSDEEAPPCASVTCASTCTASPPDEHGCSTNCLCPEIPVSTRDDV